MNNGKRLEKDRETKKGEKLRDRIKKEQREEKEAILR